MSLFTFKGNTPQLLPQPNCTLFKLPRVVRVYTKVVAHNGDIRRLQRNTFIHHNHPTLLKVQYAQGMWNHNMYCCYRDKKSVFLHPLVSWRAILDSAAREQRPPGVFLDTRPAQEKGQVLTLGFANSVTGSLCLHWLRSVPSHCVPPFLPFQFTF